MASTAAHSELRLLIACARLQPDIIAVRALSCEAIDWQKLANAAEYHGLTPIFLKSLHSAGVAVPADVGQQMEKAAAVSTRLNLFLTSELLRVHSVLKDCGITAVPLKGAALACEIYGDLGLRPFSDIDLLLRREQIEEAEAAVRQLGYAAELDVPAHQRERWLRDQCELTFQRAGMSRVELHWDIAHPHFTLDTGVEDFWSRLTELTIGDANLPALAPHDLLFMLMVHGARHAWSRLMWLVDLAELLRRSPDIDWNGFIENAVARGAGRLVATALLLVQDVGEVTLPAALSQFANRNRRAHILATDVRDHWFHSFERADATDLEPSPMWRHRWIARSRERSSQRWAYRKRVMMLVGTEEFGVARLPRYLSTLYPAIRFWNIFRKTRQPGAATAAQSKS